MCKKWVLCSAVDSAYCIEYDESRYSAYNLKPHCDATILLYNKYEIFAKTLRNTCVFFVLSFFWNECNQKTTIKQQINGGEPKVFLLFTFGIHVSASDEETKFKSDWVNREI